MGVHRADGAGTCAGDGRERPPQRWTDEHLDRSCPTDALTGMRTIIEPFRIKSVEPLRYTTLEQRESYLQEAGYNLFGIRARNILIDLLTIVSMLGLMFWLNWDFTLIALAITPFLLFFISRFKKAVKKATHQVRKEQAEIVAVVQQGLESMQVIKAFGRQDMEQQLLSEVSHATVNAAL